MSRTSPQLDQELPEIIVRAGAGAGKTTELVRRVLEIESKIWQSQKRHAKVIVTTFTRKATQELKERLAAQALESGKSEMIEFVQRASQLHISTIHGVLSIFLSRHGSAIGFNPKFQVISQRAVLQRVKKIFRKLLQTDELFARSASSILEITDLGSLLEALIKFEIEWSLGRNQRVEQGELEKMREERVQRVIKMAVELAEMIPSSDVPESWLNYKSELGALTSAKHSSLERLLAFEKAIKAPSKSKKISEELGEMKSEFQKELGELSSYYFTNDFIINHERLSRSFEYLGTRLSEKLAEEKLTTGQIGLSDIETLSFRLIQEAPQTAENFSNDWDYWLIDEYQDTSPLQVSLLKSLIGSRHSFTVGDPQQSIYLFRGARSEVFVEKEKEVENRNGQCLSMMVNYRSRAPLLLFFNEVFHRLNGKQFQPMSPSERTSSISNSEVPVDVFALDSHDVEVCTTLDRIRELLSSGVAAEKICVLCRGNQDLEILAKEAQRLSIPVQVHSSSQFSSRQEVQDATALIRFLVNPADNRSFLHLLRSPFHFVPDELLQELPLVQADSYFAAALKKNWAPALELQQAIEISRQRGLAVTWFEVLRDKGYFDAMRVLDSTGRKEANLWKLVHLLKSAEKMPGFSALDFVDDMVSPKVEGESDQDATPVIEPAKVNMMTIHASKGLQFEQVLLPFLGSRPPNPVTQFWMADDQGKWTLAMIDPEEQRLTRSLYGDSILKTRKQRESWELQRLLYVAMTRAQIGLSLLWSKADKGSLAAQLMDCGLMNWPIDGQVRLRDKFQTGLEAASQHGRATQGVSVRNLFQQSPTSSLQNISVTAILETKAAMEKSGTRSAEKSLESLQKALFGVEIHRLFEGIKYEIPQQQSLDPQAKKALRFLMDWNDGLLTKIIHAGEVEWGFAVLYEQALLQGQIDLWAKNIDGVDYVVDYKTGSEIFKDKAFQQLEIYAWALRKMGQLNVHSNPQLLVVYPFAQKVYAQAASKFLDFDSVIQRHRRL